jgi:NAD(P)-dependent dehydrogenase (short-subunit alcohol dehydrogenase family)
MDLHLKNKHVLITGGSRGIGLACAQGFLEEGAQVTIVSKNVDSVVAALRILGSNSNVIGIDSDLTDPAQALSMLENAVIDGRGPIDILVNCAGAAQKTSPATLSTEKFYDAMQAKFFTYINVIDPLIKQMAERGTGSIVNVIGLGGKVAVPTHLPGGSANAALMLSTAGYANLYANKGVRVNAVNPIATDTDLLINSLEVDSTMNGISLEESRTNAQNKTLLKRFVSPKEVADAVLFLSSDRASYINGQMLYLDGGMYPII